MTICFAKINLQISIKFSEFHRATTFYLIIKPEIESDKSETKRHTQEHLTSKLETDLCKLTGDSES